MTGIDRRLCQKSVGKTAILSRFERMDLNPTKPSRCSGNPVTGLVGQVLIHPSHVCQIGTTDQGHFTCWE
jgi:hypothetical protein